MSKCPVCKNKVDTLRSAIKNGQFISERCDKCHNSFMQSAIYARQTDRNKDKRDHAKDIIQRFDGDKINPEFVKAYPKEASKQWGNQVLRDYGVKDKLL